MLASISTKNTAKTLLLLICAIAPLNLSAAPAQDESVQIAAMETNAANFISRLGNQAVEILSDKSTNLADKNNTFQELMRQSFDLPTIARFVIGRNAWQGATPEEKKVYLDLFEKLVIRLYSDRFAMYNGEKFVTVGSRAEGERDIIVTSNVLRPEATQAIAVGWRVRNFDGRLAIIDVIVEGISMSVAQREEYGSVLSRNDNSLAPLLELMRKTVGRQDAAERKAEKADAALNKQD